MKMFIPGFTILNDKTRQSDEQSTCPGNTFSPERDRCNDAQRSETPAGAAREILFPPPTNPTP